MDGSILVCTESGHVFLRSRAAPSPGAANSLVDAAEISGTGAGSSAGKAFKFQRIPYLQRVVRVYANSAGAYAVLRVDAKAEDVRVEGKVLRENLTQTCRSIVPMRDAVQWRYCIILFLYHVPERLCQRNI